MNSVRLAILLLVTFASCKKNSNDELWKYTYLKIENGQGVYEEFYNSDYHQYLKLNADGNSIIIDSLGNQELRKTNGSWTIEDGIFSLTPTTDQEEVGISGVKYQILEKNDSVFIMQFESKDSKHNEFHRWELEMIKTNANSN